MKPNRFSLLGFTIGSAALMLAAFQGHSQIIASDNFEGYTLGAINGQGGGAVNGWAGNWDPSIANPRADVVGGALEVQLTAGATSAIAARRQLLTPLAQTFYVGYDVRYKSDPGQTFTDWAGANNTFTFHLGTNASATTVLNFGLRGNGTAGSDEFIIRYATGAPVLGATTGGQLVADTTYYMVAQVNWDGLAFTSASMWLNPSSTDNVDTPLGDAFLDFADFANPITHIFFREAVLDPDDILQADNLILGTTWGDVVPLVPVPEPGTMALVMLGGAACLAFRRRGHRQA